MMNDLATASFDDGQLPLVAPEAIGPPPRNHALISDLKIHPAAELFPLLSATELQKLAASLKTEGLLNPCVKQGDVLLDGRNRLAACKLAGVTPRFVDYTGDSPVAFIMATNLQRRHLDKGQKIALALEIEPLLAEEAKKRMAAGGGDYGNQYTGGKPGVGKSTTPAKSRDQAAVAVGLSSKLVSAAKAIKAADPKLKFF